VLVRLVAEHRRGAVTLSPGVLLDMPAAEAMLLVQDGLAVPAGRDELARETR
jgi:hypothetical protein